MNPQHADRLRAEGYTEAGIAALEQGVRFPAEPTLEQRLAQAVIVPEPWTDEYRQHVEKLKAQMRVKLQADFGGVIR